MNDEYIALRAEMLAWQNRRFLILTTSITIVIGILGLDGILKGKPLLSWELITSLLWFFLGSAAALTWYAGRVNSRLAAYIIVFHESNSEGWETRLGQLSVSGHDRLSLNKIIFLTYLGLASLSFLTPFASREVVPLECSDMLPLIFSSIWLILNIAFLFIEPPKKEYIRQWKCIQDN